MLQIKHYSKNGWRRRRNMEYSFCSKCGLSHQPVDKEPLKESGWVRTFPLQFTLLNGSIICNRCWNKLKPSPE